MLGLLVYDFPGARWNQAKAKQGERHDQRAERVSGMNMCGASIIPREEGRKAARWSEPVDRGEHEEHDAENAGEQGQRFCHAAWCSRGSRRRQQPVEIGMRLNPEFLLPAPRCSGDSLLELLEGAGHDLRRGRFDLDILLSALPLPA